MAKGMAIKRLHASGKYVFAVNTLYRSNKLAVIYSKNRFIGCLPPPLVDLRDSEYDVKTCTGSYCFSFLYRLEPGRIRVSGEGEGKIIKVMKDMDIYTLYLPFRLNKNEGKYKYNTRS